jgi:alpha-glucosidase
MRGTPTIYNGDEIAMEQVAIAPDRIRDPASRNLSGRGLGRDCCRTPMRWDGSPHAGFGSRSAMRPVTTMSLLSAASRHRSITCTVV